MNDGAITVTIRPAVSRDAEGIARTFLESAAYHASLDPERYYIPPLDAVVARYRGSQQDAHRGSASITHVAEVDGEIVGFVDARLDHSPDLMHRPITYCHVVEIAVSARFQGQRIGGQLLHAAEAWGQQQGATFCSLEYLVANKRASAFYLQRRGYSAASTIAIKRL